MSTPRRRAKTAPQPQAAPHWYCLSRDGLATLCADEEDAKEVAAESFALYPQHGPYRAVQMIETGTAGSALAEQHEREDVGKMRTALRVISTWAQFDGELNPREVHKLCMGALGLRG